MKHLGLFEGIGGFSLAARWMGWETVAWCEWNDFGQRVLRHHFPEAIGHGDITQTDFTPYANKIDILTGGFPCQPYSQAGKRLGKDDERHLFPEMLRAIREIKPTYIVGENVYGLTNWNGGVVFEEVCADMEGEGYEVQPILLPASGIGAPHHRMRVWFVARLAPDTDSDGQYQCDCQHEVHTSERRKFAFDDIDENDGGWYATDTNSIGFQRRKQQRERWSMEEQFRRYDANYFRNSWQNFPSQSPICSGDDGLPSQLDGITFPKWRNESIKGYGNAIVPQVALQIFKAIEAMSFQQD